MPDPAAIVFSGDAGISVDDARELPQGSSGHAKTIRWHEVQAPRPTIYHVAISTDEDEPTTAYCIELPGAISEGADALIAFENLKQAVEALIAEYRAMGADMPYEPRSIDEGYVIYDSICVNA